MLGFDGLELDGNLFARNDVGSQIDITERTRTNLAANAVLVTDAKVLGERDQQDFYRQSYMTVQ